jgi:imidazoleglycerol-phosphate dehydratase
LSRTAEIKRKTAETDITLRVDLDGSGKATINTGIGFFDHMLHQLAKHGLLDVEVEAKGDLNVDAHHTVEDVGICIGTVLKNALGNKEGIKRYGTATVPLDEALVMTSVDLSGRGFLAFDLPIQEEMIGEFPSALVVEFFRALAQNAGMTVHIRKISGENGHHIVEAAFKSFARSLQEAVSLSDRVQGTPSTKGVL